MNILYTFSPVSQWSNDKTFCTAQEFILIDEVNVSDWDQTIVCVFFEVEPGLFQPFKVSRRTNMHPHLK